MLKRPLAHLLLMILLILTFYPFIFMVLTSFKSVGQFYRNFWSISLPLHPENYLEAWNGVKFYILNSIIVSGLSLIGVLFLASITSYVFTRFRFFGRDFLFYAIISLLMVPGVLTLVPTFMIAKKLSLLDTRWVLILPYISGGQVFAIFVLSAFFGTIPRDLFDASAIDGAKEYQILWHLVIPLSKPILGVVAIMNLLWTWNEFMWPYVTLNDARKFVLPVGLLTYFGQYGANYGVMFAGYIIASIPLILVFSIATRTFIRGISSGALKI
ncbi:carbohydrate ABC transporter permease [Candidatus Sumerlaeota bacterium]|nr:carbohydrate ABC transporter permease [Candidatus Sumerlaeota bacterium]